MNLISGFTTKIPKLGWATGNYTNNKDSEGSPEAIILEISDKLAEVYSYDKPSDFDRESGFHILSTIKSLASEYPVQIGNHGLTVLLNALKRELVYIEEECDMAGEPLNNVVSSIKACQSNISVIMETLKLLFVTSQSKLKTKPKAKSTPSIIRDKETAIGYMQIFLKNDDNLILIMRLLGMRACKKVYDLVSDATNIDKDPQRKRPATLQKYLDGYSDFLGITTDPILNLFMQSVQNKQLALKVVKYLLRHCYLRVNEIIVLNLNGSQSSVLSLLIDALKVENMDIYIATFERALSVPSKRGKQLQNHLSTFHGLDYSIKKIKFNALTILESITTENHAFKTVIMLKNIFKIGTKRVFSGVFKSTGSSKGLLKELLIFSNNPKSPLLTESKKYIVNIKKAEITLNSLLLFYKLVTSLMYMKNSQQVMMKDDFSKLLHVHLSQFVNDTKSNDKLQHGATLRDWSYIKFCIHICLNNIIDLYLRPSGITNEIRDFEISLIDDPILESLVTFKKTIHESFLIGDISLLLKPTNKTNFCLNTSEKRMVTYSSIISGQYINTDDEYKNLLMYCKIRIDNTLSEIVNNNIHYQDKFTQYFAAQNDLENNDACLVSNEQKVVTMLLSSTKLEYGRHNYYPSTYNSDIYLLFKLTKNSPKCMDYIVKLISEEIDLSRNPFTIVTNMENKMGDITVDISPDTLLFLDLIIIYLRGEIKNEHGDNSSISNHVFANIGDFVASYLSHTNSPISPTISPMILEKCVSVLNILTQCQKEGVNYICNFYSSKKECIEILERHILKIMETQTTELMLFICMYQSILLGIVAQHYDKQKDNSMSTNPPQWIMNLLSNDRMVKFHSTAISVALKIKKSIIINCSAQVLTSFDSTFVNIYNFVINDPLMINEKSFYLHNEPAIRQILNNSEYSKLVKSLASETEEALHAKRLDNLIENIGKKECNLIKLSQTVIVLKKEASELKRELKLKQIIKSDSEFSEDVKNLILERDYLIYKNTEKYNNESNTVNYLESKKQTLQQSVDYALEELGKVCIS